MEENSKNIDLTVNPENSVINWKGYMPGGSHNGSVKIKQGHITFSEDIPVEGEVVIDMSSIKDFDLGDELKPTIENHLKSKDFFDVEHFPVATVRLIKIDHTPDVDGKYAVYANLIVKDHPEPISFKASFLKNDKGIFTIKTDTISIDRTRWGIKFGSKNFFKKLADHVVADNFDIEAKIETE